MRGPKPGITRTGRAARTGARSRAWQRRLAGCSGCAGSSGACALHRSLLSSTLDPPRDDPHREAGCGRAGNRLSGTLMPGNEPLDYLPLWALFVATVALVLLAVEAGFRLGRWRERGAEHERETPVGAIVGAILGLL